MIADDIADLFLSAGIRRVYGLPGEDHMVLLDALARGGLEYHTAFNESAAAVMASTEAQLSGTVGVVIASMAAGLSNAMNGLLSAAMDGIPLLVISGQHPADRFPVLVRQAFDNERLLQPMVKWSCRLGPGADVHATLGRALDTAATHPAGLVYVEVPDSVAMLPSDDGSIVDMVRLRHRKPDLLRPPSDEEVDWLCKEMEKAERPVAIVTGRSDLDGSVLEEFSSLARCPVFLGSSQIGLLTEKAPFFAGTFLNGNFESRLLGSADLVIWIEPQPLDYYNRPWSYGARIVSVGGRSTEGRWLHIPEQTIDADPGQTLSALIGRLRSASSWVAEDIAGYRAAVRGGLLDPSEGLSVPAAVDAALTAAGDDTCLVADAGFTKPIVALLARPAQPRRYFASHGLSTMGYAIPAALALTRAGVAPVLAFVGDGSLLMRATELAAVGGNHGTGPVAIVAIMDRSLTQIEVKQRRRSLLPVGAALPELSCTALASALGVAGVDVADGAELAAAVSTALTRRGVTLIGVAVAAKSSTRIFEVLRA